MRRSLAFFAFAAACSAQLTLPPPLMNNGAVEGMLKHGVPVEKVIAAIRTAGDVDFLVTNVAIFALEDAGARGKQADDIADAMRWRMTHAAMSPAQAARLGEQEALRRAQAEAALKAALTLVLEDGTPIQLRTRRSLRAAESNSGDPLQFEVLEDVKIGGRVVIPRGAVASGTLIDVTAAKGAKPAGKMEIAMGSVRLSSGETVMLRGVKDPNGGDPLVSLTYGANRTVPRGTDILAFTKGQLTLDVSRLQTVRASR